MAPPPIPKSPDPESIPRSVVVCDQCDLMPNKSPTFHHHHSEAVTRVMEQNKGGWVA